MRLGRIVLRNLLSMNTVLQGARLSTDTREEQQNKCQGDHKAKGFAFAVLKPR